MQDEVKVKKKEDGALDDGKLFFDEFNNSFYDEIIDLPLVRVINHAIDVVANATLVSKAPYSLSLAQK